MKFINKARLIPSKFYKIGFAVLIAALVSVVVMQYMEIRQLKKEVINSSNDIDDLNSKSDDQQSQIDDLKEHNE